MILSEISLRMLPLFRFDENPDPVGFRIGRCPTSTFKQLLMDAAKDAELLIKNAQHKLTHQDVSKLMKDLGDAIKTVWPMGLPEYEPVRMELENREILSECLNNELTKVADLHDTKLWFASKELLSGACLKDFLGNNEKSKVTIKVASKKAGQPCREPLISEQDQKLLMMHSARRREELEKLARDADDSFLDAPWADQHSLKRKVLGLDSISWKP